ncbi:MAG: hypothetical protein ACOZCO_06000 [Bacteroidota bacterium]
MMHSWKNTISAVSLAVFLLSCGGKEPSDYAEEWCELNSKIELTEDEQELKALTRQMEVLENEIKKVFEEDPESIREIKKMTRACD